MEKKKSVTTSLIPTKRIERAIFVIRDQQVMLDSDLAALYGVPTGNLTRAVMRNQQRFPEDFAFRLTKQEVQDLKSQTGISSSWGGRRRSTPLAFTQEGVAMLSSVLHSAQAIRVNIAIMRAFVRLKRVELFRREFAERLERLEREIEKTRGKLKEHDDVFVGIITELRKLMAPEPRKKPRIGFRSLTDND
jgi:DNA-binding TFAR19-related protein (PDSD5 family)